MQTENKVLTPIEVIQGKAVEEVFRRAVRHALLMHKRAGNPIAVWRDGQVAIIPPEEIFVDNEPTPSSE
ncbi:MAG TPA: hypothetical protein VKA60_08010 [Blastocatellia bacterium]|nr:hypothetical protein [Blastocatellia bacterium]